MWPAVLANLAQACLTNVVVTAAAVAGDQAVQPEQVCCAAAVSTLPHAACPALHLGAAAIAGADAPVIAPVVLPQGAAVDNTVTQVAVVASAVPVLVPAVASVLAAAAAPVHAVVSVLAAAVCPSAAVAAAVRHFAVAAAVRHFAVAAAVYHYAAAVHHFAAAAAAACGRQ